MQAPGRTDEDPRGGFVHGGWAQPGNDPVMGTVMAEGVWLLLIHPRVLGSGQRLFAADGPPATLRLTDSVTTTTGVVIATYASGDA